VHIGEELLVLGVLFVIAYILGRLGKLIGLPAIPVYMLVGLLASPNTGWFPLNFEAANVELVAVFGSSTSASASPSACGSVGARARPSSSRA
jgi:CPA2 family monovalent cation:H+ antiporter-2